jgi:hypothetical protein
VPEDQAPEPNFLLPAYFSRANLIPARANWLPRRFGHPWIEGPLVTGAGLTATVMVFWNLMKGDNSPTAIIRAKQFH